MPVEFVHDAKDPKDAYKLLMAYDGSGRRISKTRLRRDLGASDWAMEEVTHYTGIGTEVREAMRRSASPKTTVVVNLPQGLGRYLPEDAEKAAGTAIPLDKDGKPVFMGEATPEFEWYLKTHLGSTMLVYGTQPYNDKYSSYAGGVKAAYDYRAFGEQVDLTVPAEKVTENFTGKEKDDETELNYFGARYLDPMLGMWTSVDPKRQFSSPYLYAGNGMNPVNGVDDDGNYYEDGERCTEGQFVPTDYQGTVSPAELDILASAERKFMSSPNVETTVMSLAKFSKENGVESKFWYDSEGQNSFGRGSLDAINPRPNGTGDYFHLHSWRSGVGWFKNEGLSPQDVNWSEQYGKSIMGMELRSGNVYLHSPGLGGNADPNTYKGYPIMRFPAGYIDDANVFNGHMEYNP